MMQELKTAQIRLGVNEPKCTQRTPHKPKGAQMNLNELK